MYLLNPYANNFESAMWMADVFKTFTKHLEVFKQPDPPVERKVRTKKGTVTKRTAKRKRIVYNLPCRLKFLPIFIFNKYFEYVVQGVINGEFTFKLPKDRGYIKNVLSDTPLVQLKRWNLDPLEMRFKYYMTVIEYSKTRKYHYGKSCIIGLSDKYRKQLNSANIRGVAHKGVKIVKPLEVCKILAEQLNCDVDYKLINSIIEHGFSYIANATFYKADSVIFTKSDNLNERVKEFMYIRNNDETVNETLKFRRKLRVLRKMRREKYDGYYYAALTWEQLQAYKKKSPVNVRMYMIMEEAMLNRYPYNYIVKVKVAKPLYDKLIIEKEIKYAKGYTEYIWRRNGERFESIDYS